MRRSVCVFAPLLASAAVALLSGCHSQTEMDRCVDEQNRVVDPKLCQNLPANGTQTVVGQPTTTGGVYIPHFYRHYYGGMGGYALGSIVSGGSYAPVSGHSYSSTSGTSRGGFGHSFSSSSGHGDGGGE